MGDEVWLDPTDEESRSSNGTLVLSCMPALTSVTSVWQIGRMSVDRVLQASQSHSTIVLPCLQERFPS